MKVLNYCSNIIWQSLSIKLIRTFGLFYLVLVYGINLLWEIIPNANGLIINNFLIWILLAFISRFTSSIYKTILIENIRLGNYLQKSFLKDKKKLIRKSWVNFRNNLVAGIFIFFGLILLIYPGVVLLKRYQYVSLISEDLLLGPIESLKLSRKISEEKGWEAFSFILLSSIFAYLPILFLTLLVGGDLFYKLISLSYIGWMGNNIGVLVLMPYYKDYRQVS